MSFESLQQQFKQCTDLVLDRDDPLLGVLLMLQEGVRAHENLIARHQDALSSTLSANVDALVERIAAQTEKFADEALNESIREKLEQLAIHHSYTQQINDETRSFLRSIKIVTSINLFAITVITGLIVVVFFVR